VPFILREAFRIINIFLPPWQADTPRLYIYIYIYLDTPMLHRATRN
jgi:hypothetical protein